MAVDRPGDTIPSFIQETKAGEICVPYRQNRTMVFNSDLFHKTAQIDFNGRYEDRRINITMLFGRRGT